MPAYKQHLKRKIAISDIDWYKFFIQWKKQLSSIIEFNTHLKTIYPSDYIFTDHELRTWRAMMKSVGFKFWTKTPDASSDQEIISYLYASDFLNINSQADEIQTKNIELQNTIDRFWKSLNNSIQINKRGLNGKQRILSVIAKNFSFCEIYNNLKVSNDLICAAQMYSQINGPECPAINKPILKRNYISEIKNKEFEDFFSDKNNVSMSSYKVDSKTNLPLLYLKDNKQSLWEKFETIYPNGIKRTSFMARLTNGRYVYRQDLGGLCSICNEYGYDTFDALINTINLYVEEHKEKNNLINTVENLRHHLRRGFEKEITIENNGMVVHDNCINHCLLYAFNECSEKHKFRCQLCDQLFSLLKHLINILPHNLQSFIEEKKEKLIYFLAHQARKVYLNNQFKAQLSKLDDNGAIFVCDYKMRILPKSVRETKEQFFGKRGWTLHTILVFTKKESLLLDVQAFDHWSTDTKQDAWFTASSFDAVFEILDPKPKWIKLFSDNGGHYHNSELMTTVTYWNQWYNIDIRGWYFFEPGEAKSSVDSHHTQISHAIKRYIRIGNSLDNGKKIETAIKNLGGTAVANLEPKRDHVTVKTIAGITKLSYFEWPIEGPFFGYIRARTLPNFGPWLNYSPNDLTKLISEPLHKPTLDVRFMHISAINRIPIFVHSTSASPEVSNHTKSNSDWNFSIIPTILKNNGTAVANLEPKRDHVTVKTIAGITKLSYFEWPIEGPFFGYIRARTLPNFGPWLNYSPNDLTKLISEPLHKPTLDVRFMHISAINRIPIFVHSTSASPEVSNHTKSNSDWNFSIIPTILKNNDEKLNNNNNNYQSYTELNTTFELPKGWALKGNQKFGQRGSGKRITGIVKIYLESFFLVGNVNKTDRMSAKDMITELEKIVETGEIQQSDVPAIKTVEGRITRYAANLRREAAEQRVAEYHKNNEQEMEIYQSELSNMLEETENHQSGLSRTLEINNSARKHLGDISNTINSQYRNKRQKK
ncbi:hypothetical protein Glove_151g136 [Diversispora epigaea]|uniref:Uncharacterized protein n=1 Tax=Diversispora epigaea TaxID=1348612 RepID=A0A397IT52_9GLOM|nr:hypothetical protein Glove_151g136 [Diversispora epigaea]